MGFPLILVGLSPIWGCLQWRTPLRLRCLRCHRHPRGREDHAAAAAGAAATVGGLPKRNGATKNGGPEEIKMNYQWIINGLSMDSQ